MKSILNNIIYGRQLNFYMVIILIILIMAFNTHLNLINKLINALF